MKKSKTLLERLAEKIHPAVRRYHLLQTDIAVQLDEYLKEKGISQKDFAEQLNMKESQLSKIMAGAANLTLKTIARLETRIGKNLIQVPIFAQKEADTIIQLKFTFPANIAISEIIEKDSHRISVQDTWRNIKPTDCVTTLSSQYN